MERSFWHSLPTMVVFLLLIVALRIAMLSIWPFGLYADESQYWLWAQDLSFGYYSKPPMVAWAIALTTGLCGNDSAFCVKLASPIAYGVAALFVYFGMRRLYHAKAAFWGALLFTTIPGVSFSSLIISTDPFLLMFWSMAFWAYIHAREHDRWRWWLAAGVFAGLGMMSKYNFLFFGASVLLLSFWEWPRWQLLRNPKFYVTCLLALLLFIPNIWWNAAHDWVSFKHTEDITQLDEGRFLRPVELLEFIGAQVALVGPVLFLGFMAVMMRWKTVMRDERYRVLLAFVLPMLLFMLVLSLLTRAHGNWAAPVYVALVPLVAVYWIQRSREIWLWVALLLNIITIGIGGLHHVERIVEEAGIQIPDRIDPSRRVRGWMEVGEAVAELRQRYPDAGLLTDRRKVSAQLVYHARPHADDLVQWDYNGAVQDHYELTTTMQGKKGKDFLFIAPSPAPRDLLTFFERYEVLSPIIVPLTNDQTRTLDVFYARDFQGMP